MSTITLAMMARNAGETLDGAIGPVAPYVDEIVVLLGGESEDNTATIARRYTDKVIPFKWCDDFGAARNELFKHVTSDWVFWIDADDVVDKPELIPELVAEAEAKNWGVVQLPYDYAFDEAGNCIVWHQRERFLRRSLGWTWGCPCRQHAGRVHEVLYSDTPHAIHYDERIRIVHKRPAGEADTASAPRNLPLLQMMEKEAPQCRRTRLALGFCLFSLGRNKEALMYFQVYYQDPESEIEGWHAACYAAKSCMLLQDWKQMNNWAMIAVNMMPQFKDGYLLVANSEWNGTHNGARALTWIMNARDKLDAPPAVFVTPLDYTWNAWDIEHRAYYDLGMFKEALAVVEKAREAYPADPSWNYYERLYSEAARSSLSAKAALQIADHLVRSGDVLKAREFLLRYVPHNAAKHVRLADARVRVSRMLEHLNNPEKAAALYEGVEHDIMPDFSDKDSNWARFAFVQERVEALKPKRILDIGCGNGAFASYLARTYGCEVVGIDIAAKAIEKARSHAADCDIFDQPTVSFICDNPMTHDWGDEHFDLVLILELLEHMTGPDAQRLLGLAERLGDRFMASVPAEICPEGEGLESDAPRQHVRAFNVYELMELIGVRSDRRLWNLYKRQDATAAVIPGWGTWVAEWDLKNLDMPKVVFYLGIGSEEWEPNWVDTQGLGGSETAAIKLAEQFAAKGFSVVVYAGYEGIVNGVIYQRAETFNPDLPVLGALPAWLMIGSRIPEMAANVHAQHRWLWMHDTDCPTLNEELASRIDRIVVLSEWHKKHVLKAAPFVKPEQLLVSGDAIHTWVEHLQEPERHRFIWASSPDRGLDVLLTWWPAILKKWWDATLHVYYGWNNYDQMARRYPQMLAFKERVKGLLLQPGITEHGRIGQKELAEEFAKSQFWLYPSIQANGQDWYETYCISAMEAQANGCIPIVRPVGALPERCFYKNSLVDSRNVKHFLKRLHAADKADGQQLLQWRKEMADYARKATWEAVAEQWLSVLNEEERRRLTEAALNDEKELVALT